jgi:bisphosphoglycerate-independent phosphoglycerate mutase (AlkP superfamily)
MTKSSPDNPKQPLEPKDKNRLTKAINEGRAILASGGSKADAARAIFRLIHDEHREVVLQAFIDGADVTPKGSPTYYYNISRKFRKQKAD